MTRFPVNCETMEVARLACRRYPKSPLPMAMMYFESDRRQAGGGVLWSRARISKRSPVRCLKETDMLNKTILYSRIVNVEPRDEYPPFDFDMGISGADDVFDTVTVTRVPARVSTMCFRCDARDLMSQSGRTAVARELRKLRRRQFAELGQP